MLVHFIFHDTAPTETYTYGHTLALHDALPILLAVQDGESEWAKVEGAAGKSCASCHGDAEKSMKGVSVSYPKYEPKLGKLASIEHRINLCRTEYMKAPALKWDSKPLLGLTSYVALQSRGMPVSRSEEHTSELQSLMRNS